MTTRRCRSGWTAPTRATPSACRHQVQEVVDEMQASLPQGVTAASLIRTRAEAITGRLDILIDNGLMGLGLVLCLVVPVS